MKNLRARVTACILNGDVDVLKALLRCLPREKVKSLMKKWKLGDAVVRANHKSNSEEVIIIFTPSPLLPKN
jgi:hypothetical protein